MSRHSPAACDGSSSPTTQEWVSESCEVTSDPQTTLQHLLKVCDSSELGSHTFFSAKKYFVNV